MCSIMSIDLSGIDFREFPLFRDVDDVVIKQFLSAGHRIEYEAGAPLVSHDDCGSTFFLTLHGISKLVLFNRFNEPKNLALFRSGDFFGELALLEPGAPRTANIIAVTDVCVLAMSKRDFLLMMHLHPSLALNLSRVMGQRLIAMNERLMVEQLPDHTTKVAHTLAFFAEKGRLFKEPGTILLPSLPLKEWASFCYTMREEFLDGMEQLKQAGALQWQNQRIAITDLDVLKRYAVMT